MTDEELINYGIDVNQGIQRFSGNRNLYFKFLTKFLDDPNYNLAKLAVENCDYDTLLSSTHTLKGIAGNLSINDLFSKCQKVVDDIRANNNDKAVEDFQSVIMEYDIVYDAIKRFNVQTNN